MDESRITPMSQPYVIVIFEEGMGGASHGYVSTTFESSSSDKEANDSYSDSTGSTNAGSLVYKPGIISLQTEGVASIARKCTLKIIDPTLYVTKSILDISAWSNSNAGKGRPNIRIIWGWKYLLPNNTSFYNQIGPSKDKKDLVEACIDALMLKTSFDINENGVTEITIETIETSGPTFGSATFIAPIDIMNWKALTSNQESKIKNKANLQSGTTVEGINSIQEKGQDSSYYSSFIKKIEGFLNTSASLKITAGNGVDTTNIRFRFDPGDTDADWNQILTASGVASDGAQSLFSGIKINFNESFNDFINEVFSKLKLPGTDIGSYEIINTKYSKSVTEIIYGWKKSVAKEDGSTSNVVESLPIAYILRWGSEAFYDDENTQESDFYLPKEAGENFQVKNIGVTFRANRNHTKRGYYKYLINWTSDLNSKTYLHWMAQTQLQKTLSQYDQKAIEYVIDALNKGGQIIGGQLTVPDGSGNQVDASNPDQTTTGINPGDVKSFVQGFSEGVYKGLASSSSAVSAQLKSIVANNVFKATATVMGDPEIGDVYEPFTNAVYTDFSSTNFQEPWTPLSNVTVGANGQITINSKNSESNLRAFTKKWMITKTIHKIESGGYTTDIEMITYPNV